MRGDALELIRREGIFGLGGADGCLCTNFEVRGVSVEISCRKSSAGLDNTIDPDFRGTTIRVHTRSLDNDSEQLAAIAREIARQLREDSGDGGAIAVRYCSYSEDKDEKCVFCGKDRAEPAAYLCPKCLTGKHAFGGSIAEEYDMTRFNFRLQPSF